MRKIFPILILSIFMFMLGGNYLIFYFEKSIIQHEIKEKIEQGLKDDDLYLVIIHQNDLNKVAWLKPGKEFTRNGEMFDVVRKKNIGTDVYFYCINDKKESKLVSDFTKKNNESSQTNKILRKFLGFKYLNQLPEIKISVQTAKSKIPLVLFHYNSIKSEVPDPPPNVFSFII